MDVEGLRFPRPITVRYVMILVSLIYVVCVSIVQKVLTRVWVCVCEEQSHLSGRPMPGLVQKYNLTPISGEIII